MHYIFRINILKKFKPLKQGDVFNTFPCPYIGNKEKHFYQ